MNNFIETAQAATDAHAPADAHAAEQATASEHAPASDAAHTTEQTEAGHEAEAGIVGTLGLNANVFVGHFINFAIVFLVLWVFAFRPIGKKLTERADKIDKALKDADLTAKEKEEFGIWKDKEMTDIKMQANQTLALATKEAEEKKDVILRQTKEEQEKLVAQAKTAIEREKEKAVQEAKAQIAELVVAATEKMIGKKLDQSADKKLVEEMIKEV